MDSVTKIYPVGSYVTYKGNVHMVVGDVAGTLLKIINPLVGNSKLSVKASSVQPTNYKPAVLVHHNFRQYIVTGKGMIFSRTTGKVMKWDESNGDRKTILRLAGI